MLQLQVDRLTHPLLRLQLLFETLSEEQTEEKENLVYQAFLFVIGQNAYSYDKKGKLDELASILPDKSAIPDEQRMISAFEEFCKDTLDRNEIVTVAELKWIEQYITDSELRKTAERWILRALLAGDERWDKQIEECAWTLTKAEKAEVAVEVLNDRTFVRNKRKAQLAKRFGRPTLEYLRPYLRKLLWDRHYGHADELIGNNDELTEEVVREIAEDVIYQNLNSGHCRDALQLAMHFFPTEHDFHTELLSMSLAAASY